MCSFGPWEHHLYYSVSIVAVSFQRKGAVLFHSTIPSLYWRMVAAASCSGGASQWQGDWSKMDKAKYREVLEEDLLCSAYCIVLPFICISYILKYVQTLGPLLLRSLLCLSKRNDLRLMRKQPSHIRGLVGEHLRRDKVWGKQRQACRRRDHDIPQTSIKASTHHQESLLFIQIPKQLLRKDIDRQMNQSQSPSLCCGRSLTDRNGF